ncbi:hypothetical protein GGX14DRAFT_202876 [Mycena pura]|uniref:Uncharacterized protein n=1 Tax=Mycena pura TaxID=153505 RepID=A0AAD6VSM0_9AGAR|nr:hypothetical protein GGX14DRAFT_202876 [Mycena pura]
MKCYSRDYIIVPRQCPSPIPGLGTLPIHNTVVKIKTEEPSTDVHVPKLIDSIIPTAEQLSAELLDIRQEIAANLIKEQTIIQALKILNADIPEPDHASRQPSVSEAVFIEKVRLQSLQRQMESLRLKRRAVEDAIKDVARERRPPFEYPALIDAFIGISRLTTRVLANE